MATPTKRQAGDNPAGLYPTRQPSRWRRNLVLLVLLAIALMLAWTWQSLRQQALVGSAYGARVGCVCRFVSQRSLKSCEGDLKAAGLGGVAGMVSLSEEPATRTIKAGVPFLANQTASFDASSGCMLEPWVN